MTNQPKGRGSTYILPKVLRQIRIKIYLQTFGELPNHILRFPGTEHNFGNPLPFRWADAKRIWTLRPKQATRNSNCQIKNFAFTPMHLEQVQDAVIYQTARMSFVSQSLRPHCQKEKLTMPKVCPVQYSNHFGSLSEISLRIRANIFTRITTSVTCSGPVPHFSVSRWDMKTLKYTVFLWDVNRFTVGRQL